MGCFPLLVLAGLIEGMVSLNQHVGTPTRIAVSALSAVIMVGYLGFSGRRSELPPAFKKNALQK